MPYPPDSRYVSRSPQGSYLQRRRRQRGIAQARPGEPVHRPLVRCDGVPLQHLLASVRHREPRRRGRHQPDRLVLRHGEHRKQRELLPGVQVVGRNRATRLGRRRELLQREGRPGQRHAHVHRRHRHARHEPRPLGCDWPAVPAVRRHEQHHRPEFGVSMLGLPWREAMYNHGDFKATRRSAT